MPAISLWSACGIDCTKIRPASGSSFDGLVTLTSQNRLSLRGCPFIVGLEVRLVRR